MNSTVSRQTSAVSEEPFEYQSVLVLKGVGPAVAEKLEKLGIYRVQDVLFHLPLRYEDRTRVVPMGSLRHGQQAVVEGVIEHAEVRYGGSRKGRRGRSLLCHVADGTGSVLLRFFYFNASQQANLVSGVRVRCYGEARMNNHRIEMVHPEYRRIFDDTNSSVEETLTPVYPKTEGVHQAMLRSLVDQALQKLDSHNLEEYVPVEIQKKYGFPDLGESIKTLHHPPPDTVMELLEECKHPAQQRMIFEELLAHQLSLLAVRQRVKHEQAAVLSLEENVLEVFQRQLGFELTQAQQTVVRELLNDMCCAQPMMRLLQGDVGSGKTVVAACAVLAAVTNGKQSAVMAPTEILAEQLYTNFVRWFGDSDCVLLTGKDKGKARDAKLRAIAEGDVHIVIGTHALFQADVSFNSLSLIVVDEQHRFGVHQRLALKDKGSFDGMQPHQLIMTATPIPRSLAMTAYADLDYSIIDALPAGRKPICR